MWIAELLAAVTFKNKEVYEFYCIMVNSLSLSLFIETPHSIYHAFIFSLPPMQVVGMHKACQSTVKVCIAYWVFVFPLFLCSIPFSSYLSGVTHAIAMSELDNEVSSLVSNQCSYIVWDDHCTACTTLYPSCSMILYFSCSMCLTVSEVRRETEPISLTTAPKRLSLQLK